MRTAVFKHWSVMNKALPLLGISAVLLLSGCASSGVAVQNYGQTQQLAAVQTGNERLNPGDLHSSPQLSVVSCQSRGPWTEVHVYRWCVATPRRSSQDSGHPGRDPPVA